MKQKSVRGKSAGRPSAEGHPVCSRGHRMNGERDKVKCRRKKAPRLEEISQCFIKQHRAKIL